MPRRAPWPNGVRRRSSTVSVASSSSTTTRERRSAKRQFASVGRSASSIAQPASPRGRFSWAGAASPVSWAQSRGARHAELRSADLEVLGAIEQHGPLTAGQLSTLTGLSAAAVTGLIDRLEHAGVAARQADPGDRRRVLVAVSEGAQRIVELYGRLERDMTEVVARRSPEQQQVIDEFLADALAVGVDWVARLEGGQR